MVPRKIASILLALPLFAALYAVFSAEFSFGLLTAVVLGPMFMFVQVFLYGLPAMLLIEWISSFSPAYKTICMLLLHIAGAFVFSLFLAPPFSMLLALSLTLFAVDWLLRLKEQREGARLSFSRPTEKGT